MGKKLLAVGIGGLFFLTGCSNFWTHFSSHTSQNSQVLLQGKMWRMKGMEEEKRGNLSQAIEDYKKGCQLDDGPSCFSLGVIFALGKGVSRDMEEAKEYFKKSRPLTEEQCKKGDGRACTDLGLIYQQGLGIDRDLGKAKELFSRGCQLQDSAGCVDLGVLCIIGLEIPKNPEKAKELFSRGCQLGSSAGCGNLGIMYFKGDGVEKNFQKALDYFQKGCKLGSPINCERAEYLKKHMVARGE